MCNKASNEGRDKQANSLEREQEPNTYCVSQEEESLQKVYLQQLKEGNSQNPTVTLNINGIPFSLHLDTQRSGRHYVAEPSGRGTYGPGRISPGSDLEHAFTCHGRE